MHAFLISPANYIDHSPLSQAVSAAIPQCFAFLIGSSGKASSASPSSGHFFLFFPNFFLLDFLDDFFLLDFLDDFFADFFFFADFLVDFSFFFVFVLSTAGVLMLAFAIEIAKSSSSIAAPVSATTDSG